MAFRQRRPGETPGDYAGSMAGGRGYDPDIAGQPVGYDPTGTWRGGGPNFGFMGGVGPQQNPMYGPNNLSMLGPSGTINTTGIGRMASGVDPVGPARTGMDMGPGGTMGRTGAGRLAPIGQAIMGGPQQGFDVGGAARGVGGAASKALGWLGDKAKNASMEDWGTVLSGVGEISGAWDARQERKRAEEREAREDEERRRRAEIFGRALSGTYGGG